MKCDRAMLPVDFQTGWRMPKKTVPSKTSKRKAATTPATNTEKASKGHRVIASNAPTTAPVAQPKNTLSATTASATATTSGARASLSAEAALSFLRDTKGLVSWALSDLTRTLNISREEAERAVALLQIQGYVRPEAQKSGEWITTPSGETVAGAKTPRFDRASVDGALATLKQRIEETNKDHDAKFEVTRAVGFGDFLLKDRTRVQAADVGIELARKNRERTTDKIAVPHSAVEAREEQSFLRQLRGRSALINLKLYADWMGKRTHQKLF